MQIIQIMEDCVKHEAILFEALLLHSGWHWHIGILLLLLTTNLEDKNQVDARKERLSL